MWVHFSRGIYFGQIILHLASPLVQWYQFNLSLFRSLEKKTSFPSLFICNNHLLFKILKFILILIFIIIFFFYPPSKRPAYALLSIMFIEYWKGYIQRDMLNLFSESRKENWSKSNSMKESIPFNWIEEFGFPNLSFLYSILLAYPC